MIARCRADEACPAIGVDALADPHRIRTAIEAAQRETVEIAAVEAGAYPGTRRPVSLQIGRPAAQTVPGGLNRRRAAKSAKLHDEFTGRRCISARGSYEGCLFDSGLGRCQHRNSQNRPFNLSRDRRQIHRRDRQRNGTYLKGAIGNRHYLRFGRGRRGKRQCRRLTGIIARRYA